MDQGMAAMTTDNLRILDRITKAHAHHQAHGTVPLVASPS